MAKLLDFIEARKQLSHKRDYSDVLSLPRLLKDNEETCLWLKPNCKKFLLFLFPEETYSTVSSHKNVAAYWKTSEGVFALVKMYIRCDLTDKTRAFKNIYSTVYSELGISSLYDKEYESANAEVLVDLSTVILNQNAEAIEILRISTVAKKTKNAQELEARLTDMSSSMFTVTLLDGQASKNYFDMNTSEWAFESQLKPCEYTTDCVKRNHVYIKCMIIKPSTGRFNAKSFAVELRGYMTNLMLLNGQSISLEEYTEFARRMTNTFAKNTLSKEQLETLVKSLYDDYKNLHPYRPRLKQYWTKPTTKSKTAAYHTTKTSDNLQLVKDALRQTHNTDEIMELTGLSRPVCTKYMKQLGVKHARKTTERITYNSTTLDIAARLKQAFTVEQLQSQTAVVDAAYELMRRRITMRTAKKIIKLINEQ